MTLTLLLGRMHVVKPKIGNLIGATQTGLRVLEQSRAKCAPTCNSALSNLKLS